MKTFWCLYRENPFTIYFEGIGFAEPRRDETRPIRTFPTEERAQSLVKLLRTRTFVAKRSYLRQRIRYDHRAV